jgi:hypothetical protein
MEMSRMRKYFVALVVAISAHASARAGERALREPVFVPLDVFSPAQHAGFRLKVTDGRKYEALIRLLAPRDGADALSAFARSIDVGGGMLTLRLPVHLRISRADDMVVVLDREVNTEPLYGSSRTELSFRIQQVRLENGEYDVEVETGGTLDRISGVASSFGLFVRKL